MSHTAILAQLVYVCIASMMIAASASPFLFNIVIRDHSLPVIGTF